VTHGLGAFYAIDRLSGPAHVGREAALLLASTDSPTLGHATARVHIVEILDPACDACAYFFPVVERVMYADPGRIRLSIRHVACREGSEFSIRVLEASHEQGKYWEMLDALLATQRYWAPDHRPRPERIRLSRRWWTSITRNSSGTFTNLLSRNASPRIVSRRAH
jgi:hypothetical protein